MVSCPLAEARTSHEGFENESQKKKSAQEGKPCLRIRKRQTEAKVAIDEEPRKQEVKKGLRYKTTRKSALQGKGFPK